MVTASWSDRAVEEEPTAVSGFRARFPGFEPDAVAPGV